MQYIVKVFFGCLFVLFAAACGKKETVRKISVEEFFKSPEKTNFQISPDGKYISYLKPYKNRLNIYVQTIDGKDVRLLTNEDKSNVNYYCWANDNQLLYKVARRGGSALFTVDKNSARHRELIADEKVNFSLINPKNIINNRLLVTLNKRDSTLFDVYSINLQTGNLTLVEKNPGNVFRWIADEEGKIRMAMASDGVNETLLFRRSANEPFKKIVSNNFKSKIIPVGFCGKDKDCIFALCNINTDKLQLVKFDCRTGKEVETIFSNPDVDIAEANYSFKAGKLISAGYETWKKEFFYIDENLKNVNNALQKLLPNTEIVIADYDSSKLNYVIKTFTDRSPGAFYLYSPASGNLTKLSDVNPSINVEEMCEMKPVSFTSRDGKLINGYLTLPLKPEAKKLPVVVLPHGGPEYRNSWGFSSEVQFLANRGYAVYQINYRGSAGYGKIFWRSGFKKWGTEIQDDITDGVKWLIDQGIADKNRIGIYGSGFGGFSAILGLCLHPELYACGVSQAGYLNLFTYLKAVPPYYKPTLQMYYEKVGNPERDLDYLRSASPVFHSDKIKAPVFLAQDADDPRVKVNETNQFVRELRKRNVPVTYIVKENENYSLRNPENRIDFYMKLEEFLEKNLKVQ